jgi:hypothetical protein
MSFETWFNRVFPCDRKWFSSREYENLKTAYNAGLQSAADVCTLVDVATGSGENGAYVCLQEIRALYQSPA